MSARPMITEGTAMGMKVMRFSTALSFPGKRTTIHAATVQITAVTVAAVKTTTPVFQKAPRKSSSSKVV